LLLANRHVNITNLDYKSLLSKFNETTCVYLDPPYFGRGNILYQYSFSECDHNELCDLLERARFHWVLSYDDHPMIRRMYKDYDIREVNVAYTIHGVTCKKELLISPKREECVDAANDLQSFYVVATLFLTIAIRYNSFLDQSLTHVRFNLFLRYFSPRALMRFPRRGRQRRA